MDIQRNIVYIGLLFVGLMLWAEWQKEQYQEPQLTKPELVIPSSTTADTLKKNHHSNNSRVPTAVIEQPKQAVSASFDHDDIILVTTDLLTISISKKNGNIVGATLKKHLVNLNGTENYQLMNTAKDSLYLAEMGLIFDGQDAIDVDFTSAQNSYNLIGEQLEVVLTGVIGENMSVSKRYIFTRGKHAIVVNTAITNNSDNNWLVKNYYQLVRKEPSEKSSGFMLGMSSYLGASISDPNNKKYEKISFADMAKKSLHREVSGGWVAMQEHYFLGAFIPVENSVNTFYSQDFSDGQYGIGYYSQNVNLVKGTSHEFSSTLYIGPEYSDELQALSKGLELTIDYGWLWFISSILFAGLKYLYSILGNWGWSIIVLTILIKLLFYRLSSASYRSMAAMKKFQPKVQELKERFGDDKQQLNQAMIELYRKEKVNPLGGCLPMIVQIPVFIALYWVLLESVELRHSPFIFWIYDLTSKDPYFVLPILMGGSMFLQQKMSPPPADPTQAKVMQFLPVVFTLLFISVPAGLVLYWTVNNLLSISQQWYINKKLG